MSRESADSKQSSDATKDWIPERIGSWKCIERLGQGGMGDVFLCEDELCEQDTSHRRAAVKIMRPMTSDEPEALKRFKIEAEILQRIQSSRVASLIEFGSVEVSPLGLVQYMVMEYVEGRSLSKLIRLKRLTFPEILSIGRQIGEAVAAIHSQGFLHRDLKPENVMVTDAGLVKLIDFGVAKPVPKSGPPGHQDGDDFRDLKTKTGFAVGTTYYMAPEIVGGRSASFQSDIYSLGLIIWEMVVGRTPFKSQKLSEILRNIEEQSLSWPDPIVDIAPSGFLSFINRLLSKTPEKRPDSAIEVASELGRFLEQADWPDVLNRRAKLGDTIWWDNSVLDRCKGAGLSDCELPFALPAIEDRVKGSYPFSDEAIDAGIASYKSARYQCAMKRQGQLRDKLRDHSRDQARDQAREKGQSGSPIPQPVATLPRAAMRSRVSSASQPAGSKLMFWVIAGLCVLLAFVTKKAGVFDRIRLAGAESLKGDTTPKGVPPGPMSFHFSAENSEAIGSGGGAATDSHFTRTRVDQSIENTTWALSNGETRIVPRAALPLEIFFSDPDLQFVGDNGAPIEAAKIVFGENRPWVLVAENLKANPTWRSTHQCTRSLIQKNRVGPRELVVWNIECQVTKRSDKGEILETATETYKYSPEIDMMLAGLRSVKIFAPDGRVVGERESSLNIDPTRYPAGQ